MKKFILKLDLHDDKDKRKALKIVSSLQGIDSIAMDMKEKKLTVIGTVDPIPIVSKLRKFWNADIITVGPAKEPEKKEEPKKEEAKKDEAKKEEPKKEDEAKKEEPKKDEAKKEEEGKKDEAKKEEPKKEGEVKKKEPEMITGFIPYHRPYYPPPPPYYQYQQQYNYMQQQQNQRPQYPPANTHYYLHQNAEENPNTCVIS